MGNKNTKLIKKNNSKNISNNSKKIYFYKNPFFWFFLIIIISGCIAYYFIYIDNTSDSKICTKCDNKDCCNGKCLKKNQTCVNGIICDNDNLCDNNNLCCKNDEQCIKNECKKCDKSLLCSGDGKCCTGDKTCVTNKFDNKTYCCPKGQTVDKNGVCCDKNLCDDGICCASKCCGKTGSTKCCALNSDIECNNNKCQIKCPTTDQEKNWKGKYKYCQPNVERCQQDDKTKNYYCEGLNCNWEGEPTIIPNPWTVDNKNELNDSSMIGKTYTTVTILDKKDNPIKIKNSQTPTPIFLRNDILTIDTNKYSFGSKSSIIEKENCIDEKGKQIKCQCSDIDCANRLQVDGMTSSKMESSGKCHAIIDNTNYNSKSCPFKDIGTDSSGKKISRCCYNKSTKNWTGQICNTNEICLIDETNSNNIGICVPESTCVNNGQICSNSKDNKSHGKCNLNQSNPSWNASCDCDTGYSLDKNSKSICVTYNISDAGLTSTGNEMTIENVGTKKDIFNQILDKDSSPVELVGYGQIEDAAFIKSKKSQINDTFKKKFCKNCQDVLGSGELKLAGNGTIYQIISNNNKNNKPRSIERYITAISAGGSILLEDPVGDPSSDENTWRNYAWLILYETKNDGVCYFLSAADILNPNLQSSFLCHYPKDSSLITTYQLDTNVKGNDYLKFKFSNKKPLSEIVCKPFWKECKTNCIGNTDPTNCFRTCLSDRGCGLSSCSEITDKTKCDSRMDVCKWNSTSNKCQIDSSLCSNYFGSYQTTSDCKCGTDCLGGEACKSTCCNKHNIPYCNTSCAKGVTDTTCDVYYGTAVASCKTASGACYASCVVQKGWPGNWLNPDFYSNCTKSCDNNDSTCMSDAGTDKDNCNKALVSNCLSNCKSDRGC